MVTRKRKSDLKKPNVAKPLTAEQIELYNHYHRDLFYLIDDAKAKIAGEEVDPNPQIAEFMANALLLVFKDEQAPSKDDLEQWFELARSHLVYEIDSILAADTQVQALVNDNIKDTCVQVLDSFANKFDVTTVSRPGIGRW